MLHQALGVHALGVGEEAEVLQRRAQPLRVALERGLESGDLQLDLLLVELLCHPEVEERHLALVHQQVVAGMGVGVEVLQVVDRAVVEAVDDLADAVALFLRQIARGLEALAVHPLGHEHAAA